MKKFLKIILILPLIFSTMLFVAIASSCNEKKLSSIDVSVSNITEDRIVNGEYVLKLGQIYNLSVSFDQQGYSIANLEWLVEGTEIVRVHNDVLRTLKAGKAQVRAKFVDTDGKEVKSNIIKIIVQASVQEMSFGSTNYEEAYSGLPFDINKYKITQHEENMYDYFYYNITDGVDVAEGETLNAGKYFITCKKKDSEETCSTILTIKKYKINFVGLSGHLIYGEKLESAVNEPDARVYNKLSVNNDYVINNGIGKLGIGKDAQTIDGDPNYVAKFLYTTQATDYAEVGDYETDVAMVLCEGYERNYEAIPFVAKGTFNIQPRKVVVAINNQTINYGSNFDASNFVVYNYNKEICESVDFSVEQLDELSNERINYKNRVNRVLGSPTFKYGIQSFGSNANKLPVFVKGENNVFDEDKSYEIYYDIASIGYDKNIRIEQIISGQLIVEKLQVIIEPNRGQSKVFGEIDPTITYVFRENTFVYGDNIAEFLFADYNEEGLGEGNKLASKKEYYYKVNNVINSNYDISLSDNAKEALGGDNTNKIKFNVLACPIHIELNDLTNNYKNPLSGAEHTLSYYGNSTADYNTTLKSIKINNVDLLTETYLMLNGATISNEGRIKLKDEEGSFSFSLTLSEQQPQGNSYKTYKAELTSKNFVGAKNGDNYEVTMEPCYLNLTKIYLTVVPKLTTSLATKTYDATDNNLPAGFSSDYQVYSQDGTIFENISSVISNSLGLLKLTNNNRCVYAENTSGNIIPTERTEDFKVRDVGSYKIFINPILVENMDYYQITLDTSTDYYFKILPFSVLITPRSNEKIYGKQDRAEDYSYDYTELPEGDRDTISQKISGILGREEGKDVGNYAYTIGNLSFGINYSLVLNPVKVYFKIKPRAVNVIPNAYVTTYGDNYPQELMYDYSYSYNIDVDERDMKSPVFAGTLSLNGTKVGDKYPVKIEDGEVADYSIIQGSLTCDDNYEIVFDSSKTYRVNKRNINVDINSQHINAEDKDSIVKTNFVLDKAFYTISNLLENTVVTSFVISTLDDNDAYLSATGGNIVATFTLNGIDVSNCYNIVLGKNIVYSIDVTIIYLAIKTQDLISSIDEVVYSGYPQNKTANDKERFCLVCQTEGYEVANTSNITFEYAGQATTNGLPQDAGSYVVSVSNSSSIVIKNNNHTCNEDCEENCANKYITLDLEGNVTNNLVASISNFGYLNITRANIIFDQSKLAFEDALVYGSENLDLLLLETLSGEDIFKGVRLNDNQNEKIYLKNNYNEDNLNYSFLKSNYVFSSLEANGTHQITVTIQAVKSNGTDNNNYNPLTINVPLVVVPKGIVLNDVSFTVRGNQEAGQQPYFDGKPKAVTLNVDIQNPEENLDKVAISYSYTRLSVLYTNSTKGLIKGYDYDAVMQRPNLLSEKNLAIATLTGSNLAKIISYNGVSYFVIEQNNVCLVIAEENIGAPINAGVYICMASCEAQTNYILTNLGQGEGSASRVSFFCIYEIEKSSNITITNWKEKFSYTTVFNFSNPSTLPFEYNMSPNFIDSVVYNMEEPAEWPENNILSVGDYRVNLSVNNDNYYYSKEHNFTVDKLEVEFVFPTLKTYTYLGENVPITSFLNNIRVIEKNKDGYAQRSYYYTYGDENENIQLDFYNSNNEKMATIINSEITTGALPYAVGEGGEAGEYKLVASYNGDNYSGQGEFIYYIVARPYAGFIRFQNTTLIYNPTYTTTTLYDEIYRNMFSIGLESGFVVKLYFGPSNTEMIRGSADNSWVRDLLSYGQKTIKVVVEFEDGITADYESTAFLTITKFNLSPSLLRTSSSATTFTYNGYEIYDYLVYNNIPLDFSQIEQTAYNRDNGYVYYVEEVADGIKLKDNLGNAVFTVSYVYEEKKNDSSEYTLLTSAPRNPNKNSIYRVRYNYIFDVNYSGNSINLRDKEYSIKKAETLFIFVDNLSVEYSESGLASKQFFESIIVTNDDNLSTTNMLCNFVTNDSDFKGTGVYLKYTFENAGSYVASPKNAGTYDIYLSLLFNGNYNIQDYFNYIKINDNLLRIDNTFINNKKTLIDGTTGYSFCADNNFLTITPYNYSNHEQKVFELSNFETLENGEIIVNDNTTISSILSTVDYIEIYKIENSQHILVLGNITTCNQTIFNNAIFSNKNADYIFKVVFKKPSNNSLSNYTTSNILFKIV